MRVLEEGGMRISRSKSPFTDDRFEPKREDDRTKCKYTYDVDNVA